MIVVLDTFYYFPDPRAAVAAILRLLRPGGLTVIEVPAAGTRLLRVGHNPDRLDLFYYSAGALTRLLHEAGFTVESVIPLPANHQRGLIRQALYSVYSAAARVLFPLSRGQIMLAPRFAVAARKPGHLQSD